MIQHPVRTKIRDAIRETLVVGAEYTLDDDDSLFDSGTMDSIGLMELIERLENEFQIKVEDDEVLPENLDSVSAIAEFLGTKGIHH